MNRSNPNNPKMRKQKDISIGGHTLLLEYNDGDTDFEEISTKNAYRLMMVILMPKFRISEAEGELFFKQHHNYIISEMRKVISENNEFYNKFDVNYNFASGGCRIDPPTLVLIDMDRSLDIKLKPEH